MSFTTLQAEKFATVFDKSDFSSSDPIVKIQHVQRGNNVVFGRTLKGEDYTNLIYIGKVSENTLGRNYLSADAWLDVTFPHVIYISGARGSGKSFDLGVLIEGVASLKSPSPIQNQVSPISTILIDTQSQFWTLKYAPNAKVPANKSQLEQLKQWNISPNAIENCDLYIPESSEKITGEEKVFHIRPNQVKHEEWCALVNEEVYSSQGHILGKTLEALDGENFSIERMIQYVEDAGNWPNVAEASRNALLYKLDDYRRTKLFSNSGINIRDLLSPGKCSIFLLRDIRNEDKSLITGVIARQLFTIMGDHHKKSKVNTFFDKGPLDDGLPEKVWLVIDEAHVVAPSDSLSPARDALVEYVKRGRDAGLSLVLATQQPSAIDDRILSQVNITFSHRLTFQSDINSAVNRIPTKLLSNVKRNGVDIKDFGDMLRMLESGQCFLGDHNSSRAVLINIRPRITSHGGYSPV